MINQEEMLPMLVACPSFKDKWREHKAEYADEENFLPFLALAELARHLIGLENLNQTKEFEAVFETVEQIHLQGSPSVKEAITIGFLEALQNNLSDEANKFVKYLKPESLIWWNELNKFWNGETKFVGQTVDTSYVVKNDTDK